MRLLTRGRYSLEVGVDRRFFGVGVTWKFGADSFGVGLALPLLFVSLVKLPPPAPVCPIHGLFRSWAPITLDDLQRLHDTSIPMLPTQSRGRLN